MHPYGFMILLDNIYKGMNGSKVYAIGRVRIHAGNNKAKHVFTKGCNMAMRRLENSRKTKGPKNGRKCACFSPRQAPARRSHSADFPKGWGTQEEDVKH